MTQEIEVGEGYLEIGFTLDRTEARKLARRYFRPVSKSKDMTHTYQTGIGQKITKYISR